MVGMSGNGGNFLQQNPVASSISALQREKENWEWSLVEMAATAGAVSIKAYFSAKM